jgi:hypothetical protein
MRIHHGELVSETGREKAHVRENACRGCGFLGDEVQEYPIYDPVVSEGFSNKVIMRKLCIDFVTQGFDECIENLPAIVASLAQRRNKADQLRFSLPLETLRTMLRTARTAVIRYYMSSVVDSDSPLAAASFGGILWRALKASDSGNNSNFCRGWREFGRDYFPTVTLRSNLSPLASSALFAAVAVPLVMQVFDEHELALFADGSFSLIHNVWHRIAELDTFFHDSNPLRSKVINRQTGLSRMCASACFRFCSFCCYFFVVVFDQQLQI